MAGNNFMQRLADSELPRRVLGAMITVFAPGAGHVILGHRKIGAIVAAVMLALFGLVALGAFLVVPALFLAALAIGIFLLVVCIVSVFALPPGPGIKDGLRALWPAVVILAIFRLATFYVGNHVVGVVPVPSDTLAPDVRKGDTMLVQPGPAASPGDVVLLAEPDQKLDFRRMDATTPVASVRGRALFVFASGAGDGRGRIWKSLRK